MMIKLLLTTTFLLSLTTNALALNCTAREFKKAERLNIKAQKQSNFTASVLTENCVFNPADIPAAERCEYFIERSEKMEMIDVDLDLLKKLGKKAENRWYSLHEVCTGTNSTKAYNNYSNTYDNNERDYNQQTSYFNKCIKNININLDVFCQ